MDLFQPDQDELMSPVQASPDLVHTIKEESNSGPIQVEYLHTLMCADVHVYNTRTHAETFFLLCPIKYQ